MTRQVLFHDFDGVLHRDNSYLTPEDIVSSAPGRIELFEYAAYWTNCLNPIRLSKWSCLRIGRQRSDSSSHETPCRSSISVTVF